MTFTHSLMRLLTAWLNRCIWSLGLILILIGLIIGIAWPPRLLAAPPAQQPETSLPSVSGGRALWSENCLPCHGPTGQGDGPATQNIPDPLPDFTDPEVARRLVPAQNFEVIKNGRIEKLMPPWGNRLSDAQIWDLTAYVWSLSLAPETLATGEMLYLDRCAACHGDAGRGDGPDAPAEIIDFSDWQIMAQRSQADLQTNFEAGEPHATIIETLSETELWQLLDYVRTFSFILPQPQGVLSGQVMNATTNRPQPELELTLHAFEGNTELETFTTRADSAGHYRFERLPTEHTIIYVLEGTYQNVAYTNDEPGLFVPDSAETTLNLNVYETTNSAEAIGLNRLNYLMFFTPDALKVVQIFILGNDSNRTYIGQDGRTLSFALPAGATRAAFEDDPTGDRFIKMDEAYADTEPIRPGGESHSIVALYDLPYAQDALSVEMPLPADVASLNVLLQEQGAQLNSSQLQFVETRELQGSSFLVFNGTDLAKGETLNFELTNLDQLDLAAPLNAPEAAAPGATIPGASVDQTFLRWLILGLGVVVIVLAGAIYPFYLRPETAARSDPVDSGRQRQKLLLLLARLDQVFETGELDEQVYRQARAKYKAELAEMMEG